jgi:hypothetical protein
MRNFLFLALIGFSFLITGCGAVRTVANNLHHDICVTSYNMFVCAETTPLVPVAKRQRTCYGVAARTSHGVDKIAHTEQGPFCAELQKETVRKAFKAKAGVNCYIKGKGLDQEVVCAGLNGPVALAFILLFLLGRLFPRTKVVCGVVGALIGAIVSISPANAKCVNLSSYEDAHKAGDMYARMSFQVTASTALPLLKILVDKDASQSIKKFAMKTLNEKVWCNVGSNAKEIIGNVKATKDFLKTTCSVKGGELVCAGFHHAGGILLILLTLLWGRGLCDFMVANVENEGTYHNRYLDKDYVCSFSKMWAACKVMIIALIAIIILLASATNLYAACTEKQIAANKVTTQYGFLRYDCHKDEVPQAEKDAIFEVVWRGFVAKGGLKMDMSKPYVYTRWQRLESVFFKVWGDAPLWQAKVAVAICTKEYVCGVSTKFSEWEGKRWESRKNHNGSVDCGITQINSDSTDKSCDELQDYETAFREQRRILMEKIKSEKKSVWKERVFRYNGSGKSAREYGRIIMSWAM